MSEPYRIPYMTPEEYLKYEEQSTEKHEYVNGQVFLMSGATEAHDFICTELFVKIHAVLAGTGCRAYPHNRKVHVKIANSFYYPDIVVTCESFKPKSVFSSFPCLLVEILSPSTRSIDRREKLVSYRQIPSLKEYVIIHSNKKRIEFYKKETEGQWTVSRLHEGDDLCLESLPKPLSVSVNQIYNNIEFTPVVEEADELDLEYDVEYNALPIS